MICPCGNVDLTPIIAALPVQKRRRGNPSTKAKYFYKDIICAFDIETSLIKTGEHQAGIGRYRHLIEDCVSIMYIWQMQIGLDITIYGRTWDDFLQTMTSIVSGLEHDQRLVIYVHNLAYEWQFLRDQKVLGAVLNEESVFCVKSRTPVKFLAYNDKIEFRCSYIHSNMSLGEFTDKMHVQHGKLSGDEFDYSKRRMPWTELTDRELEYCVNDVRGLVECLYKECEIDGDNLYTIPLTSTGYVRRDIKRTIQTLPHNYIKKQLPDYATYRLLREAFRGGNTHASRFVSGRRIDKEVRCMDFSSSYPNVLINNKFPITPFREMTKEAMQVDNIVQLIKKGRAVVARIAMDSIKLHDQFWPVPYLTKDKSRNIVNAVYDNGRILSADYLETTVTDIDLMILIEEYDANIQILDARFASYGYIPNAIKEVIREYFRRKTKLKGSEDINDLIQYVKAKNKLNAIYGMSAQNPVKLEECYMNADYITGIHYNNKASFISEEAAEAAHVDIYALAHEENIEKSTMPYQWGVWVTAWARYNLEQAIRICRHSFLYCDTDSVYFYGNPDFTEYNRIAEDLSRTNGAYAIDQTGETHYMGVLELDKTCTSFITMGAKKYAYIDKKGLHITIAGVNKHKGADELTAYADAHGLQDGLDAMTQDFIFTDAGGTESVYNDTPSWMTIDGNRIYVPSNVAIKPSTYKIGLSEDYGQLLAFLLDNGLIDLYRKNYEDAPLPSVDI